MASPSKAWVTIADSQVDADSPGDTTLVTGFRDDLVHLREWLGMSYTAAQNHDHDGVNSALSAGVLDGSVTPAKMSNAAAGDYIIHINADERQTTSTSYVKVKETKIGSAGTYRIKFSSKHDGSGTHYARIYKNGSSVGTERNPTTSYAEYSEDISGWAVGDLVQVYIRSPDGIAMQAKDLKICVAAPHIAGGTHAY